MAIYSFSAKVFSRSNNDHATAAAAYRSGSEIYDERTRKNHDYTPKTGVLHSEIITPDNAPAWMHDRAQLWNYVERQEKRGDAQLARDIMAALPHELSFERQRDLVRGFCEKEFVARGMIADLSIHAPDREGDERNTHAHIMLTLRPIEGDHFAGRKAREWNSPDLLTHWREAWAEHCNTALEAAGFDARVDHRSLEAQGVDRAPTEHMGKAATAYERDGILTERGDRNREAEESNRRLDQLVAELAAVDAKIAALEERRLDAAYGTAEPVITDDIERELSARFEGWQPVSKGVPPETPEPVKGGATDAPPPVFGEPVVVSEAHSTWRRLADRARAFAHHAEALWHDESGAPKAEPELPAQPEPSPPAPEPPHSWLSRVMDSKPVRAGWKLLHGWSHRDGGEMAEGAKEAGDFLKARIFPTGSEDAFTQALKDTVAEGPRHAAAEMARRRAEVDTNGDGGAATGSPRDRAASVWRNERGSLPDTGDVPPPPDASPVADDPSPPVTAKRMTALERLAARATAPEAAASKPMTAFDRLAAKYLASLNDSAAEPDDQRPTNAQPPPEPSRGPDIDI